MYDDMNAYPLPDWATLVLERLAHPRPMTVDIDAARVGAPVLRQLEPDSAPGGFSAIRMSGLGKCIRSIHYDVMGYENTGRKIDGRTRATFAMGDMAEQLLMVTLAEVVQDEMIGGHGWYLDDFASGGGQGKVTLECGGHAIPGHPDGMLECSDIIDKVVVECKSASSYSFATWRKSMKEGVCPWTPAESYWWQIQGYMHATGAQYGYVLALCKDSGAIMGFYVNRNEDFLNMLEHHLSKMDQRDAGAEPPRELADGTELGPVRKLSKRTGKPLKGDGMLAWQCRYCSHFRRCWGAALREDVVTDYRGMPSLGLFIQSDDADADR